MSERMLPPLVCPGCDSVLEGEGSHRASSFSDCARRCEACGIGYSNALNRPTIIYRNPLLNLPAQARPGAESTLGQALNIRNRPSKLAKFGFSTSEDAVTWTVFSYLASNSEAMHRALSVVDPELRRCQVTTLLWGVPIGSDNVSGRSIQTRLIEITDGLGEEPRSRSEPDVVLDLEDQGLIFIEVKYRSGNDKQPSTSPKFKRYLDSRYFDDSASVRGSGLYELARNWRIGAELAGDRPFWLLNLGMRNRLGPRPNITMFQDGLRKTSDRTFRLIDWSSFVRPWGAEAPPWLEEYLKSRLDITTR